MYVPLHKWPILSVAEPIHFKITFVVKFSKKGRKEGEKQPITGC